jgi:hypothetical protein
MFEETTFFEKKLRFKNGFFRRSSFPQTKENAINATQCKTPNNIFSLSCLKKKTYQTIPMADHHFPHGHVLVVNPPFLGPEKQLSQRALGKGVLQGNSQL